MAGVEDTPSDLEILMTRLRDADQEGCNLMNSITAHKEKLASLKEHQEDQYYHLHKKLDDSYELIRDLEGVLVERGARREKEVERLKDELADVQKSKDSTIESLRSRLTELEEQCCRHRDIVVLREEMNMRRSELYAEQNTITSTATQDMLDEQRCALREKDHLLKEIQSAKEVPKGQLSPALLVQERGRKTAYAYAALSQTLRSKSCEAEALLKQKSRLSEEAQKLRASKELHVQALDVLKVQIARGQQIAAHLHAKLQSKVSANEAKAAEVAELGECLAAELDAISIAGSCGAPPASLLGEALAYEDVSQLASAVKCLVELKEELFQESLRAQKEAAERVLEVQHGQADISLLPLQHPHQLRLRILREASTWKEQRDSTAPIVIDDRDRLELLSKLAHAVQQTA
jgi:hypothetical protein